MSANPSDLMWERINYITVTPEQEQRARMFVATHATGVEDCRELLDMLGLMPEAETETAA